MTELQLPPLVAQHSPLWLQVDLSSDQDCAWRAAAQLQARPQWAKYRTPAGGNQLVNLMKQAMAIGRRHAGPSSLGFILIPTPKDGIKGMATLSPVDLHGRNVDGAVDNLTEQLAPGLAAGSRPEVTRMQTPAGDCRRIRLRQAGPEPGDPDLEQIGYLWVFDDHSTMSLIMSFTSPHEAQRWLPALDQLASGIRLQRSGGEPGMAASAGDAASRPAGVAEIRPVRPDGKLLWWERRILASWRLAADPHFGTLTLSGDRRSGRKPQVFQLPATGQPGAVTAICLAAYQWKIDQKYGSAWRMLFLDRENRIAGAGVQRDYWMALRLFRPEAFDPLKAAGVRVVSEWYDSTQALEDAYPGGAGKAMVVAESQGKLAAIGLAMALAILIIVGVAVYFSTH